MFPDSVSRISSLKLASLGAIAATALTIAPTALAAPSGGVPVAPALIPPRARRSRSASARPT